MTTQLWYTIQHRTVLIVLPWSPWLSVTAQAWFKKLGDYLPVKKSVGLIPCPLPLVLMQWHSWCHMILQRLDTTIFYTTATLASPGEVQCEFPTSPLDPTSTSTVSSYLWYVSISNDNATFSNELSVLVYDSRCLDCQESGLCTHKVGRLIVIYIVL